jgi:plastocyanin domain-containing protein
MNTYGIFDRTGCHVDVSKTEKGAKQYATRNGYDKVSIRYNGGYHVDIIAIKKGRKWLNITH